MRKCSTVLLAATIVLTSVFTAGCISSSNQNATSPTPTPNQTLKTMVEELRNKDSETMTINAWKVSWIDANKVRIDFTAENATEHVSTNETIRRFNTTNDATNYLTSQVGGYQLESTIPPNDSAYARTTGHNPSVYEYWTKINESSGFSDTGYILQGYSYTSYILQADTFVMSGDAIYRPVS
jgi:outer membrane murein-binding lipoprotein Lpp